MKNFKKLVGKKIRKRRDDLGLGQEEIADFLNTETARVSNYERGVHLPEGKLKAKLLKILKAEESLLDIDEKDSKPPPLTPDEAEFIRLFRVAVERSCDKGLLAMVKIALDLADDGKAAHPRTGKV